MAATWTITKQSGMATLDSLSEVITELTYVVTDSQTVGGTTYTGRVEDTVGIGPPDSSSFTAKGSVTDAQRLTWAKNALGTERVAQIEANVAGQISGSQKVFSDTF